MTPHESGSHRLLQAAEEVLHLPELPASRWHRAGFGSRGERILDFVSAAVLSLLTIGWVWTIVQAHTANVVAKADPGFSPPAVTAVGAAITSSDAPTAAFVTEAALNASLGSLRGESGKLRAVIQPAGSSVAVQNVPTGSHIEIAGGAPAPGRDTVAVTPAKAGIWKLAIATQKAVQPVADFSVITQTPLSARVGGRVGLYFIGYWPTEKGRERKGYVTPNGLIEVTPENANTALSEHFRIKDFLTHGQENVWPKYLVIQTRLIDKLELVLQELEKRGISSKGVRVMSGFRTPSYNATGGNPNGRAGLSRHMFGDASDIYIDNNGDGQMDDLNHDGRINIGDARVLLDVVNAVERAHPALTGGCGVYPAASGHGPFTHIDTRGYPARWIGTGDGG